MTIQTKGTAYETELETYLPEINMTLLRDRKMLTNNNNNETLEDMIIHRTELVELRAKLEKINTNLQNSEESFFTQKHFVYPTITSGIVIVIIIIIAIYIIIKHKRSRSI